MQESTKLPDIDPAACVLGIDIGGTKVAVGVVSGDGQRLAADRIPTQAGEPHEKTMPRMLELCRRVIAQAGIPEGTQLLAGGIVSPGPLDLPTGVIVAPKNLPGWRNVPIVRMLSDEFGMPFYLDNDANAAALAEHRFGAGRGSSHMIYLTLSTGIGGGIIVDDQLYRGQTGNAGELGHMSVAFDGVPCVCGSRGCIEAYSSGTALAKQARAALAAGEASSLANGPGGMDGVTGEAVVEAVRRGDPLALKLWDRALSILGMGLTNLIHIFNPRRIVIGGGISNAGDLLFEPLRRHTMKHTLKELGDVCKIVPAQLGAEVGVMGAAALALEGAARAVTV